MKKNIFLIFLILFFSSCAKNQKIIEDQKIKFEKEKIELVKQEKKDKLKVILNNIVLLIKTSNSSYLNDKYIKQDFGIYRVFIDDKSEQLSYEHSKTFEEIDNYIPNENISFENISFVCKAEKDSSYGWSKDGVFVNENFKNIALKLNLEDKIRDILKDSYQVIITNNIVFYLTYIENEWYITLIDEVISDCTYENIQ